MIAGVGVTVRFVIWAKVGKMVNPFTEGCDDRGIGGPVGPSVPLVRPESGRRIYRYGLIILMLFMLIPPAALAVPAGTVISNTALATYGVGSLSGIVSPSNTVTTTTAAIRTPSTLEFLQYAPTAPGSEAVLVPITEYSASGTPAGPFVPLPPPTPAGSSDPIDLSNPIPLVPTAIYHQGEPLFLRLTDQDQDLAPLLVETVLVTVIIVPLGESELLRLRETGPHTGVFVGYIQSAEGPPATPHDGIVTVDEESEISASYVDVADSIDTSASAVLVDPFGIVFDSSTGLPVNGATITLINTDTGLPAVVFGDDGVSSFPATITSGGTATDSGGTIYTFSPGGYRFPFVPPGNYRLNVAPPAGYIAPSTFPTAVLQSLPGAPFAIVEPGSRGEPFVLNPGPAFRIDIPIDRSGGGLWLRKTAGKEVVATGDFLPYSLSVENTTAGLVTNVLVTDRLPLGFRYEHGSTKMHEAYSSDPAISPDGRVLTFTLGNLTSKATVKIRYVVEVAAGARLGEATNRASARGDGGVTSNIASATVEVREDLFRSKAIIVGRVIADNCRTINGDDNDGVEGVRIYLEDGSYVVTDEQGMFHFEGLRPGTHVVQLDVDSLPEQYEVVPCEGNNRFAGREYSQFVDVQGGTLWRTDFHVALKPKLKKGDTVGHQIQVQGAGQAGPDTIPVYDKAWLERAEPGLEWLLPGPGFSPSIPSLKVAIKHHPNDRLTLLLEGRAVSPLNFEGMAKNSAGTVAISRWTGVDLTEGDNHLEVIAHNAAGREIERLQRTVHYSGPPAQAELVIEQSSLIADGRTPPVVAVRLKDRDGYPARAGVIGRFSVDPPHGAQEELEAFRNYPLSGLDGQKPHYVVGEEGVALVRLRPTSQSGEAVLRFHLADGDQEIRVWLQPEDRDWILVGLAEGTAGYNTVKGHMENLDDADIDERLYEDGRIAFFAKGRIKGTWLLTLAYDTARGRTEGDDNLFQTIDPDTYYTLYGDGTQQEYEAASARALYVKIERGQFYALFGDYDTGLTVTELSRYNRSFNGLKSELQTEDYGFNVFASETDHAFVKDEIRGDGTSGLYRLSRKDIVVNSEKVVIETRDRFRSEVILSSRGLSRHIDYNIDYDAGTLFFREPIYSKDGDFNPIYIVVDYESNDPSDDSYHYGGRGAIRLLDQRVEVGATYVHEGQVGREGDLVGVDATVDIGRNTQLKAESATTMTDFYEDEREGEAYLLALDHHSGRLDGTLYAREQGEEFGLGQQRGSESGTRKFGVDAAYRLHQRLNITGQAYRQFNLGTDAERDLGEIAANLTGNTYSLHSGMRHAEDRMGDGTVNCSNQITAGGSKQLVDNRLQLRLDHEQSLGRNNDNPDFPTRTTVGADYRLANPVALFADYEFTQGEDEDTHGTRAGIKATPWTGAQAGTSLENQYTEYGARVFANLGLNQTWQVNEKWGISGGVDHSRTVKDQGTIPFNVNVDPSSGGVDNFTAVSLGTTYREEMWSWSSRLEFRYADDVDRWGVTSGIYGEPSKGLGLSAGIQILRKRAEAGDNTTNGDLRLGLAYRPRDTRWIVLDRLDFIVEEQKGGDFEFDSWRIVNNMNANYELNRKTQISLQYGAKYVRDTIDGDHYSGYTDLMGLEARYNLTGRWDIGVRESTLHSWRANQFDYSAGISLGYNILQNAWVSVGYNVIGFEDEDFSRGNFTAKGPFLQFRMKFDQTTARDVLGWFGGK